MVAHLLGVALSLRTHASSALTMTALVGVGLWGHHTHWRMFPGAAHAQAQSTDHDGPAVPGNTAAEHLDSAPAGRLPNRVEFDSPESLEKSGIAVAVVSRQPMVEEV